MITKKAQIIRNGAGGIDFRVERDRGNEVLILTGKKQLSLKFWKGMVELSKQAVEILENE